MHLLKKAQIAYLKVDKAPIEIFNKYKDFDDNFSLKLATEVPEHCVNYQVIKLVNNK